MKNIQLICLLLIFGNLNAQDQDPVQASETQDFYYKNYNWKETPENFELSEEEKKLDEVIVKFKKTIHLVQYEDRLNEYHLTHKIVKLNNDKAIERNNKYYVPNGRAIEVVMQKARVINPNGKIITLSEKDIIDSKDENGNVNYQYFAFEGVEVGSVIEYLDIIVYPSNLTGSTINVQGSVLKKNVEIDIISPKHIEYLTYPINGLENFVKDTTVFFNRRIFLNLAKVEPLEEEPFSSWDANIKKVYFKFNRNVNTNKGNFYTYSNIASDLHERYFAQLTKKEKSDLTKLLNKSGVNEAKSTEDKVRMLENYLKKEIGVIDGYFDKSEDISQIISKKITTDNGFYKLLINCLRELKIDHELVLTCDRYEDKFLTEYEAYNFLQEFLIYVKEIDQYLTYDLLHRLGYPPDNFVNNKGLFMSEVRIGDLYTGIGKVKFIKGTKPEQSIDVINTKTSFSSDFTSTKVEIERIGTGYKAQPYQSVIDLLDEVRREELKNEYLNYIDNATKVENMTFENDKSEFFGSKPFVGRATMNSVNFIEKGGENYLFKVGMLIGPQSQLYNEGKRELPVETGTPRRYERKIEVEIPEGFAIKNPEVLKIDIQLDKKNNSVGFTSSYTIEGNKLVVIVNEWYNDYIYSVEDYPFYEAAINAAADFNKLVLVLQKK